jgi:hypothetical protein
MWVQKVSSTPATRLDVINLQVCMTVNLIVCVCVRVCRSNWITCFKNDRRVKLEFARCVASSTLNALVYRLTQHT